MCLKGSPRCYPHAKEAHDNAVNKLRKAENSLKEEQESLIGLPKSSPAWNKAKKRIDACNESVDKAKAKAEITLNEMEETAGGIKVLDTRLQNLQNKFATKEQIHEVAEKLVKAENGYADRLHKYDIANQTVNSKLPSGYASQIGLEHLNEQKDKLYASMVKARKDDDNGKYHRLDERYHAVLGQIDHAKLTMERIDNGELSRFNAPPSPALKKTPRYQNYVKTASAARTIAQEHKELAAIGLRADGSANVHKRSSKRPDYDEKIRKIREYKEPLQPGIERPEVPWYQREREEKAAKEINHVIDNQGELF